MAFTDDELKLFELQRALDDSLDRIIIDSRNSQLHAFRTDFEQLAFRLVDQEWHLPPKPHHMEGWPPFRTMPIPRRLPIGPLRRMAKLVGIEQLREVFRIGSPKANRPYRLIVRERTDSEYPDNRRSLSRAEKQVQLIRFGNAVLALEAKGLSRTAALNKVPHRAGDIRQRRWAFAAFKELILGRPKSTAKQPDRGKNKALEVPMGYIPRPNISAKFREPEFPISLLTRKRGKRKSNR